MKNVIIAAFHLLLSATRVQAEETKPTIYIPAEKCPQYTTLLQRYFVSRTKHPNILECRKVLTEREKLLSAMMAYGQNSSCYSDGWKGSEVIALLQNLTNRNHAEMQRCQAWLSSGRVCADGHVCPVDMSCTAMQTCDPTSNPPAQAQAQAQARHKPQAAPPPRRD